MFQFQVIKYSSTTTIKKVQQILLTIQFLCQYICIKHCALNLYSITNFLHILFPLKNISKQSKDSSIGSQINLLLKKVCLAWEYVKLDELVHEHRMITPSITLIIKMKEEDKSLEQEFQLTNFVPRVISDIRTTDYAC